MFGVTYLIKSIFQAGNDTINVLNSVFPNYTSDYYSKTIIDINKSDKILNFL